MENVTKILDQWINCHREEVSLGELISRDPIAHKWKCTYRLTVLRELVFWRTNDLLRQVAALAESGHTLGARILLRSAIETICVLIYLNVKIQAVLNGNLSIDELGETTSKLMLGSRDGLTNLAAISVVTIINKHCEKRYPGIADIYSNLSESAHPNYDGICSGYSFIDEDNFITHFENRWKEKYENSLEKQVIAAMKILEEEYNNVFIDRFESLERWLVKNDNKLEKTQ